MKNKIQTIKMVNIFSNQYEVEFIMMLENKMFAKQKNCEKIMSAKKLVCGYTCTAW